MLLEILLPGVKPGFPASQTGILIVI